MGTCELAFAKINLFLDVTSRRPDGFHDILSIMHSVSLFDEIEISAMSNNERRINISSNDPTLPTDESNIVYSAAMKFLTFYNIYAELDIHIKKRIPVGAGLGGGSSDAAATLRALSRIFGKGNFDDLYVIACEIGSDVPFCLRGGACICRGRGERLEPIDRSAASNFVIAIGNMRVSTPKAYAALDLKFDNFSRPRENYPSMNVEKFTPYNIFEEVTDFEEIAKIKEIMTKNGAEYTLMSGSGPSVFAEFEDPTLALKACSILQGAGFTAFNCSSVYPEVSL